MHGHPSNNPNLNFTPAHPFPLSIVAASLVSSPSSPSLPTFAPPSLAQGLAAGFLASTAGVTRSSTPPIVFAPSDQEVFGWRDRLECVRYIWNIVDTGFPGRPHIAPYCLSFFSSVVGETNTSGERRGGPHAGPTSSSVQ